MRRVSIVLVSAAFVVMAILVYAGDEVGREAVPLPAFLVPVPSPVFLESVPSPVFSEREPPPDTPIPSPKIDAGLSLVVVTSKACLPCQKMRPILDRVGGKWSIRYVDFDDPKVKQWLEVYQITSVPYYVTYRGHEAIEVAEGLMTLEEVLGWLGRVEQKLPPDADSRFKTCTAQDSLKPIDREYLQMRLTPGSCGMLGCMAHGGGWITELAKETPETKKPKGHWEMQPGSCPTCPSTRVWVADPDPTGTVPWDSGSYGGGWFGRRWGSNQ